MTPEQFARVESLFEGASEQPPGARAAWLRERCPDDPEVLRKVEGMLARDAGDAAALDVPAMGAGFHVGLPDDLDRRLRDELAAAGRFRVLSLLGEGGFGSVYRAEQLQPVRRPLALKVIKLGMDTRRILARFDAERQTLAVMNHPGIARLLDAGVTPSGRPYFAMELAEGPPITAYCEEHGLGVRARLELFIQVCDAIRHAHQRGVLHRDIKPSNVLIAQRDGAARPVVIDFGIARALGDADGHPTLITEQGQMVGTPEYMSPEQAAGSHDIDTRTDVYALGVLLYRLLTGTTPFDRSSAAGTSLPELQRLIRGQDAPRPSSRVRRSAEAGAAAPPRLPVPDPAALSRLLQRDLDWVVMKALERDRSARYESVDALAADLRRYLADEPILARPQSAAYRFGKFARRNRSALVAAGGAVALLLGGVVGTTSGMVMARRQARVAQAESSVANAVSDFLNYDLLTAIEDQHRGHDVTMREILDTASQRIEGRFDDQPRIEQGIRASLGRAYRYLGLYHEAGVHLERAVELGRRTPGVTPKRRLEGLLGLAEIHNALGRPAEAEPLLEEALAEGIRAEGENGWFPLLIMNSLAQTHRRLGRPRDAEELYRRVIAARQGMGDAPENQRELFFTMSNLVSLYIFEDRLDEALPITRSVLDAAARIHGPEHSATLKATYDLALLHRSQGRLAEAEAVILPIVPIMQRTRGDRHPHTLAVLSELAVILALQERLDEALALRLRIVAAYRELQGDSSAATRAEIERLIALYVTMRREADAAEWRAVLAGSGG